VCVCVCVCVCVTVPHHQIFKEEKEEERK